MQATVFHSFQTPSYHENPSASGSERDCAIASLLDLSRTESNAQGSYLYKVDLASSAAKLILWSGISPIVAHSSLDSDNFTAKGEFSRTTPLVLQEKASEHGSFKALPEFRNNRFEGAVSIPLLEAGEVIGLLNICRSERLPWKPREFAFLLSLAVPIAALMAASVTRATLEREVEKLAQQLADRKLLERAKGLIQSRFEWTEEQAYLCIRNLSRRRRTPMRRIAEEVIATAASVVPSEVAR